MSSSKMEERNGAMLYFKKILIISFFLTPLLIRVINVAFIPPKLDIIMFDRGIHLELFNKIKFNYFIMLSFILFLFFIFSLTYKKYSFNKLDGILFFVIYIILLSSYVSEYKGISFWGIYDRADGSFYWILLFLVSFFFMKMGDDYLVEKIFNWTALLFLFINVGMSIFHYLGVNILNFYFFRLLIGIGSHPPEYLYGYFLGTLENPNYISGYSGMLFIYFITGFFIEKNGNKINSLGVLLSYTLLVLSVSSSGIFAVMMTLPALLYVSISIKKVHISKLIIFIPLSLITLVAFTLVEEIKVELGTVVNLIGRYWYLIILYFIVLYIFLNYVGKLKIKMYNLLFVVFLFIILITIFIPNSPDSGQHFPEKVYSEEVILAKLQNIEERDIDYGVFSGREFMWWYTWDLIKEKPIIGHGLGSLSFEYPQTSILKLERIGQVIVTKPHSHYLELYYGAGFIVLTIFIFYYLFYILLSLNKKFINSSKVNLKIALMSIAFLIQGLVNDSNVGTYIIMFILIGSGYSTICKEEEDLNFETIRFGKNKKNNPS